MKRSTRFRSIAIRIHVSTAATFRQRVSTGTTYQGSGSAGGCCHHDCRDPSYNQHEQRDTFYRVFQPTFLFVAAIWFGPTKNFGEDECDRWNEGERHDHNKKLPEVLVNIVELTAVRKGT
jgi:hypothetical protein